jgi:hypothetical protein
LFPPLYWGYKGGGEPAPSFDCSFISKDDVFKMTMCKVMRELLVLPNWGSQRFLVLSEKEFKDGHIGDLVKTG